MTREILSNFERLCKDSIKHKQELEEKLFTLTKNLDPEHTFQSLAISLLLSNPKTNESTNASLIELAAYHLYSLLEKNGAHEPDKIQEFIYTLKELNQARSSQAAYSVESNDKNLADIQSRLQSQEEFVRGNAYPFQTRLLIEKIQGPFEKWFKSKIGIGPLRILYILDLYEKILSTNIHAQKEAIEGEASLESFLNEFPGRCIPTFEQMEKLIPEFNLQELNSLQSLIGLTQKSRKEINHPREIKNRPIYFLSVNRFIFVDLSSVYDALFEALEDLARSVQKFHDKHYEPSRRKYMEEEVYQYCLRLFPSSDVYKNLKYSDPNNPKGETELDIAICWGSFLVIIEAKGVQFRKQARIGKPAHLRDDIKYSIGNGFKQASRAINYINSHDTVTFKEDKTGRMLNIRKKKYHRIFPVVVTLHQLSGLATQIAILRKSGLFRESSYPWSVSLTDLDLITKFTKQPDTFLFYIQRRLELQHSEKDIIGDELDLFAHFLDTRLDPSRYWERKEDNGQSCDLLIFGGASERFDRAIQADLGLIEHPNIELNFPPNIITLLDELRQRQDDGAKWIAFSLHELSPAAIHQLDKMLEYSKKTNHPSSKTLKSTFKENDLVITLIIFSKLLSEEEVGIQAKEIAYREKYRLKSSKSIAIGINAGIDSDILDCAFFMEYPWQYDSKFEEILLKEIKND